ncbi:MAG: DUF1553 domain-containing protein, partial [Pirellulaceae bacterium]
AATLFCLTTVDAAEPSRRDLDLFENHVRPTLVAHCIKCHGETKQEGGLKLTTLADLQKGGESGPAVVAGDPAESLIIQAVRYESIEMPPEEPIDDKLIAGLVSWVEAGATWPEEVVLTPTPTITDEDRQWWCYQPIAKVEPPTIDDHAWTRNEIDRFVYRRLAENEIQPADEATALTLARRVHFAVTGLPPDEATVQSAMSETFDYEALVDQLLESPAYGENQARSWLDLVRYADTDGYRADHERPDAFAYRDYVIRSFNADKPYDQFVREQLAGDEIDPGNRDAIIATMYLRHWIYEHNQRDVETQWHEVLGDITETTADVFLAQGLKCARCHDHKFDPLLQNDYFRMKAFFAAFQPVAAHPVASVDQRTRHADELAKWESATEDIRTRLREIEYPVALKHATREGFDKFIPEIKSMILTPAEEREPYEKQIAAMAERQFDLPYDKLDEWLSDELKAERKQLQAELAKFDSIKPKPLPEVKFVATDVGPVAPVTFNPDDAEKTPIEPGFITLLDESNAAIAPTPEPLQTTGRRTALADWIVNRDNPLTARVIVNRIWQQHFGRGLVETTSDFGRLGSPPSHPELLDYLAGRLVHDSWSLKKLHRLILTSATYRQTSQRPIDRHINRIDPGNRLLWRMNPRRLSGEEINDAFLVASGELEKTKRAIYKSVKRNSPDPLLASFDGPDRIRSIGRRHRTVTSTQSLLLANSDWTNQRAELITNRLADSQAVNDAMLIQRTYRTLFGRDADDDEVELGRQFIQQYAGQSPKENIQSVAKITKFPHGNDSAVDLDPSKSVVIKSNEPKLSPESDFTVEGVVLLRSLFKDASVRTIAARWDGSKTVGGWSLGVTSDKSAFQPRNLILQLVGKTDEGEKVHYEVVASGLRVPLNKPCYVAASVRLNDPSDKGVMFYLRDLSSPDAKLQSASAKHTVVSGVHGNQALVIGSRLGKSDQPSHQWDGLVSNLRIENRWRDLTVTPQADSADGLPTYTVDYQFENADAIGRDSSGNGRDAAVLPKALILKTPRQRARVAFVHALLNSNELIYVD